MPNIALFTFLSVVIKEINRRINGTAKENCHDLGVWL
jgi:hypothetical protein